MTAVKWILWSVGGVLFVAGYSAQLLRWLRVLQGEKYRGRAVLSFLRRWAFLPSASANAVAHHRTITSSILRAPIQAVSTQASQLGTRGGQYRTNARDRRTQRAVSLPIVAALLTALSLTTRAYVITFLVVALYGLIFPWGMPIIGRHNPLVWTLRTSAVAGVVTAVAAAADAALWPHVSPLILAAGDVAIVPILVAAAAPVASPIGRRLRAQVRTAGRASLEKVAPRVVAITGTYGKSSVRHFLEGLLAERVGTQFLSKRCDRVEELASMVSNELRVGTATLVVELGVGEGDVEKMVDFLRPSVAIVTGVGPSHLDVLRTQEQVDAAVMAPVAAARTAVVNRGDVRLAQMATAGDAHQFVPGRVTIEVEPTGRWLLRVDGNDATSMTAVPGGYPSTVACAATAALALGVSTETVVARLPTLTAPPTTVGSVNTAGGLHVYVDIRGSSPAEGSFAVRTLRKSPGTGRKVLVTPGVVQLGASQGYENFRLGALAAQSGVDLVAVARTNAEALADGYGSSVRRFDTLREAREWVRRTLGEDDSVMYFNDLPDYYP